MTVTLFRVYCGLNEPGGDNGASMCQQRGDAAVKLAAQFFQGFTAYDAMGSWKGENEPTKIVELMCQQSELSEMKEAVYRFAGCYKDLANQESVMITTAEIGGDFV